MRDVKYGMAGGFSDVQMNRGAAQAFEAGGYDFMIWADQMSLTIPRTIWTPDIIPAAAVVDVDAYMEPWPLATDAATHTDRMELGITVCDAIRRTPATYAQLALTLDHFSQGRFFLAMGTGGCGTSAPTAWHDPSRSPISKSRSRSSSCSWSRMAP